MANLVLPISVLLTVQIILGIFYAKRFQKCDGGTVASQVLFSGSKTSAIDVDVNVRSKIIHVTNPFIRSSTTEFPVHILLALQSQRYAASQIPADTLYDVEIVAGVLKSDFHAASAAYGLAHRVETLRSSTAEQYADVSGNWSLPFFRDLLDVALMRSATPDDIIVITNSDILVDKTFYATLLRLDRNRLRTINKRIVDGRLITNYSDSIAQLAEILPQQKWKPHIGVDCYVLPVSEARQLDPGNLFFGVPPIGFCIRDQMRCLDAHFVEHLSAEGLTYHFDDDKEWVSPAFSRITELNKAECARTPRTNCRRWEQSSDPPVCLPAPEPQYAYDRHQWLFTGPGYSATGLSSAVMHAIGFDVGHETLGLQGTSCWMCAFPSDMPVPGTPWFPHPRHFKITIAHVRHPLSVLRSGLATKWLNPISPWKPYSIFFEQAAAQRRPELNTSALSEHALNLLWWLLFTQEARLWAERTGGPTLCIVSQTIESNYVAMLEHLGIKINEQRRQAVSNAITASQWQKAQNALARPVNKHAKPDSAKLVWNELCKILQDKPADMAVAAEAWKYYHSLPCEEEDRPQPTECSFFQN